MTGDAEPRVRLTLQDADNPPGPEGWPVVTGRIINRLVEWDEKLAYVVRLDTPMRHDSEAERFWRSFHSDLPDAITELLLFPAPPISPSEVPADYIGEQLVRRQGADVTVFVVDSTKLPRRLAFEQLGEVARELCSGACQLGIVRSHRRPSLGARRSPRSRANAVRRRGRDERSARCSRGVAGRCRCLDGTRSTRYAGLRQPYRRSSPSTRGFTRRGR